MVDQGRSIIGAEGLEDCIEFVVGDACATGLPSGAADFVWSEDAWIYVPDKAKVVAEAVRLVRPGGRVAFTDWVEGPTGLSDEELESLLPAMRFPSIETIDGYVTLLEGHGCEVTTTEYTSRFALFMERYVATLEGQLRYDALKILDFNEDELQLVIGGFQWLAELGQAGKLAQGRVVATRAS